MRMGRTFIILNHNSQRYGRITRADAVNGLCAELVHVELVQVFHSHCKIGDHLFSDGLEGLMILTLLLYDVTNDWAPAIVARRPPCKSNGRLGSLGVVELLGGGWWT